MNFITTAMYNFIPVFGHFLGKSKNKIAVRKSVQLKDSTRKIWYIILRAASVEEVLNITAFFLQYFSKLLFYKVVNNKYNIIKIFANCIQFINYILLKLIKVGRLNDSM